MSTIKRFHFFSFDLLIIIVGLFFILLGGFLFVQPGIDTTNVQELEPFGLVKVGAGTRKLGNSLQWFDVNQTSQLYYGDSIFANEKKDIEIELEDKVSKLVVPVNSMIKITKSGDEFNLDVSKGSVVIKTTVAKKVNIRNKAGKVQRLEISSGSDIKISSQKSNVMVETLKGNAAVIKKNSKKKTIIEKGKMLVVSKKNKVNIMSKTKVVGLKEIDPVFRSLVPLVGKFRNLGRIEYAARRDFKKSVKAYTKNGGVDISDLSYGEYYIREIKSQSYDSFEIRPLKELKLIIAEQEKYYQGEKINISWNGRQDLSYEVEIDGPEKLKKIVIGNSFELPVTTSAIYNISLTEMKYDRFTSRDLEIKVSKDLIISGLVEKADGENGIKRQIELKNPRNITYRFKILNDQDRVVRNLKSKKEVLPITKIKPGLYKVKLESLDGTREYYTQEFTVKDTLISRMKNTKIVSPREKVTVPLTWGRAGNFPLKPEYIVKVFDKKDAEGPIFETRTKRNTVNFITDKIGQYYWTIDSSEKDYINPSKLNSFAVGRPNIQKLKTPKIILRFQEDEKCYQYTLPKVKYANKYEIMIFSKKRKVKGKPKLMYKKVLRSNIGCIASKGEGGFFYRYRVEDRWKRVTDYGPMGTLFFPISPLDDF